MVSMLNSRRGEGPAFSWIMGLVSLFGLGVLFIVFSQVFHAYLVPTIKDTLNASYSLIPQSEVVEIYTKIDTLVGWWDSLPYVLFIVVVIYMIVVSVRKETLQEQI